jgi:hypothetical protein
MAGLGADSDVVKQIMPVKSKEKPFIPNGNRVLGHASLIACGVARDVRSMSVVSVIVCFAGRIPRRPSNARAEVTHVRYSALALSVDKSLRLCAALQYL